MASAALIEYIKVNLAKGYSPAELKQHITAHGYNAVDVDVAIDVAMGGPTQQPPASLQIVPPKTQTFQQNFTPKQPEPKKEEKVFRPAAITVISIIMYSLGGIFMIGGLLTFLFSSAISSLPQVSTLGPLMKAFSLFVISFGSLHVIIATGLWGMSAWGRVLAIAYSILLILSIAGLPIGIVFLYFLLKQPKTVSMAHV
jgi:hypothetical protein